MKAFMSTKLKESNEEYSTWQKIKTNFEIQKIKYNTSDHENLR